MKEIIKVYKNTLVFWYLLCFLFCIFLIFNVYQIIKIINNYQKFMSVAENKRVISLQIENLYSWISKIDLDTFTEPKSIPIEINLETKGLSGILSVLSPLYFEEGSLFIVKNFEVVPCEKTGNQTFSSTCSYTLNLSGEKIRYRF